MTLRVEDEWNGWDGDTIVKLTDGTIWRQVEYRYEYKYAYRPRVAITGGAMLVEGMSRPVRVERVTDAREANVDGEWTGWSGDTVVRLTDGSVWQQAEYLYEYSYSFRPEVLVDGDNMLVEGMSQPVGVRRIA